MFRATMIHLILVLRSSITDPSNLISRFLDRFTHRSSISYWARPTPSSRLARKRAICVSSAQYFPITALVLFAVGLMGCGPSVKEVVPGLPGDGTGNLPASVGSTVEPAQQDLWANRELLEPPAAKPPVAVSMPKIERFVLKNGLQVIAVHDSSLPTTSLQLAVRVGKQDSKRETIGLAEFTATMLTRGTRSRNAARIASEIEAIGGSLAANASFEATLLSCKSLSKDLRTCLGLLPDLIANSTFPEAEISLLRANLHSSVRQRLDDAGQLATAHFQSALWGDGHVRGLVMSSNTIEAISRKDMVQWHKTWMRPNNAILAISGDFNPKTIQAELNRSFGRWRKAPIKKRASKTLPTLKGIAVRLVDKPGQTQSHIRVGHLGLAHGDPDFYAAMVFNHSLGGGQFSSRLMTVVRSQAGKAYTASSSIDRNQEVGAFVAGTFTRSAETLATIRLLREQIALMAKSGPKADEISGAITNIAGSYATRFESAGDIASALLAAELHDFDASYVSNYPLRVAGVGLEAAKKAAARVLDPDNLVIVIVGDADVVEPQLKKAGWSYERIAHTEAVSNWERTTKSETGDSAQDPTKVAMARKVLDAALAAKGGEKKIRTLKGFRWVGAAQLNLPTGAMTATVEKRYSSPDKLRLDMEIGGGQVNITTVLNGSKGWAREKSPRGEKITDFSAPELKALGAQLWRDSELVLLRHREAGAEVEALGERSLAGRTLHAIRVLNPKLSRSVTLLIDSKSKMLVGMDYEDQGMKTTERFEDYKKIAGVQVAHGRTTKGPQVNLSVTLNDFDVGKMIAPGVFERPQKNGK